MKLYLILHLILPLFLVYCKPDTGTTATKSANLSVVTYNVNNLFDAKVNGSEYPDYLPENGWSAALYNHRLNSISDYFSDIDADIIALQEVENANVSNDLADLLDYPYNASSNSRGAIQQALLSRVPIILQEEHGTVLHSTTKEPKQFRNMLHLVLEHEKDELHVIVLHWKSKRGGAKESEIYRRLQAKSLQLLIDDIQATNRDANILILGDFNESPDEYFRIDKRYPTALASGPEMYFPSEDSEDSGEHPHASSLMMAGASIRLSATPTHDALYSPWLESNNLTMPGSYFYQGRWEQIDGVLATQGIAITGFTVLADSILLAADGSPKAWKPWFPEGYSDHLPLFFILY